MRDRRTGAPFDEEHGCSRSRPLELHALADGSDGGASEWVRINNLGWQARDTCGVWALTGACPIIGNRRRFRILLSKFETLSMTHRVGIEKRKALYNMDLRR